MSVAGFPCHMKQFGHSTGWQLHLSSFVVDCVLDRCTYLLCPDISALLFMQLRLTSIMFRLNILWRGYAYSGQIKALLNSPNYLLNVTMQINPSRKNSNVRNKLARKTVTSNARYIYVYVYMMLSRSMAFGHIVIEHSNRMSHCHSYIVRRLTAWSLSTLQHFTVILIFSTHCQPDFQHLLSSWSSALTVIMIINTFSFILPRHGVSHRQATTCDLLPLWRLPLWTDCGAQMMVSYGAWCQTHCKSGLSRLQVTAR